MSLDGEQRGALESVAETLRGLGHEVGEADPDYPDPSAAFVPQFLGGIRAEAALVEHPERLERRTKQTARARPPVPGGARSSGRSGRGEAHGRPRQPLLRPIGTCC